MGTTIGEQALILKCLLVDSQHFNNNKITELFGSCADRKNDNKDEIDAEKKQVIDGT